ncbi:NCS1 family nucleobase:cation symporter-1 [Actinomycetospora termitidis]|uniref:NCS1 family nucleobase:cation symporter-1 n=1 Tax=Actinomycetospora termitidis TaxID=3053470 RepID=A0ABT7MEL7_9PSEU|nr:NCS1 family nucleobase:cation symporter-1 [Actinomycetospora sp. Odt1-22]MDL5159095.1 NCS1 family nucleobase:cation symporter-1 [Actinomycetospora sp. Odt1-22]
MTLHSPPDETTHAPPAAAPSDRLYNADLAPTSAEGRRWGGYNIFTLWASDVHSLGNYGFVLGLFALGLGAWQIVVALAIGAALLFGMLTVSGEMGRRTGVPFPVMSRISFGIRGAQIPALVRGVVAIAWFGIQTYLATKVLSVMVIALVPSAAGLDAVSFLGLSALGWICFVALWLVQVGILLYGMDGIRRYEAVAGPIVLVTLLVLAIWMLVRVGGDIAWSVPEPLTGGRMWVQMLGGASLWVAVYGTFLLNFCDFTRSAPTRSAIVRGNFWGIPLNVVFFGIIAVVLAGGQFRIDGRVISSPVDVVHTIPDTFLLVLASAALLVLTIAVNLMANFVAPSYALANLLPRVLTFRSAGVVSAVIGLVILPWNLYDNPGVIVYFLGVLGALLGPLFGVIAADYWLVRRARIDVPALYSEDPVGPYHYRRGINPRAVGAFVPAAVLAVAVGFVPALDAVAPFSWFVGALIAAAIYVVVSGRRGAFDDVSGEAIAVAPGEH